MSTSIIGKFVSIITNKQQQQQEEDYKPTSRSRSSLARLRAEIVGIAASLKYEKQQLKKKLPESMTVLRPDGSGHYDKIYPQASHTCTHMCLKADLKASARAKLIAYALLRGKNYKDVENSERPSEWWKSWEFERLAKAVTDELVKNAWNTKDKQWFNNYTNVKKMMGAPTDGQ